MTCLVHFSLLNMTKLTNFLQKSLHFANYVRYRSVGMVATLITLSYYLHYMFFILLIFFLIHTFLIYKKEDGGTNHLIILRKLGEIQSESQRTQKEVLENLKLLNEKLKK